jgi:hypothetical protein
VIKVCQWLATGRWFSLGTPVSSTNKTDGHDITEILLNVALGTITKTTDLLQATDKLLSHSVVLSTPVLEQQSTEIDTSTNAVWFMVFNVTFNNISVISS